MPTYKYLPLPTMPYKFLPLPTTAAPTISGTHSNPTFPMKISSSKLADQKPVLPFMSNKHTGIVLLIIVTLCFLTFFMFVLISFCVARCILARKLVRNTRRCSAHSNICTSVERCEATSTSYGPIRHLGPLDDYTAGELELPPLSLQKHTGGLNTQRSQNVDVKSNDIRAQRSFDSVHEMSQQHFRTHRDDLIENSMYVNSS